MSHSPTHTDRQMDVYNRPTPRQRPFYTRPYQRAEGAQRQRNANYRGDYHRFNGDEIRKLQETIEEQKATDREFLGDEIRKLRETIEEQKARDREFLGDEIRKLRETIGKQKATDREFLMEHANKNSGTKNTFTTVTVNSQEAHSSLQNRMDPSLSNGQIETEILERGEDDVHTSLQTCAKKSKHNQFMGVDDLKPTRLPNGLNDKDLVELIKATADLTVRVDVAMPIKTEPELGETKKLQRLLSQPKQCIRVGTGMLCEVENIKVFNKGLCKCLECKHSKAPSKVWGSVKMITSTFVVAGDLDARSTSCRLFYDRADSLEVTLKGWMVEEANDEKGWIVLKCVTCDVRLLNELDTKWKHWRYDLWDRVNNKYKGSRDENRWSFIVSHPHGYRKKISFGKWIERHDLGDGWIKYAYETNTCPGSTGAYVHLLGYNDWDYRGRIVHRGVDTERIPVSCAGVKLD